MRDGRAGVAAAPPEGVARRRAQIWRRKRDATRRKNPLLQDDNGNKLPHRLRNSGRFKHNSNAANNNNSDGRTSGLLLARLGPNNGKLARTKRALSAAAAATTTIGARKRCCGARTRRRKRAH